MKKIITVLCGAVLLSSCGNKMMLMKRHYTNGFYLAHSGAAKSSSSEEVTKKVSNRPVVKHSLQPASVAHTEATTTILPVGEKVAAAERPSRNTISEPARFVSSPKHLLTEDHKLTVKADVHRSKNALHQSTSSKSDQTIIEVILCFLIPPLAVYLHENSITSHFWIDLILCFLFFLPGVIYALIICLG